MDVFGKSLPVLTNLSKGKFGCIIFESIQPYLAMDSWNRQLLDKYCRDYGVGIIYFMGHKEESLTAVQLGDFPLTVNTNLKVKVIVIHNGHLAS